MLFSLSPELMITQQTTQSKLSTRDYRLSLVAQTVKCLPTMRETWVWSLGQEDPLEKEMATHSSNLAWKIPWVWVNSGSWWWTGRPGVLWFMGSQRVGHDWVIELNWTELLQHTHKNWNVSAFTKQKVMCCSSNSCVSECSCSLGSFL